MVASVSQTLEPLDNAIMKTRYLHTLFFTLALCLFSGGATASPSQCVIDTPDISACLTTHPAQSHHNFHTHLPSHVVANQEIFADTIDNTFFKNTTYTTPCNPLKSPSFYNLQARYLFAKATFPPRYILFESYLI